MIVFKIVFMQLKMVNVYIAIKIIIQMKKQKNVLKQMKINQLKNVYFMIKDNYV